MNLPIKPVKRATYQGGTISIKSYGEEDKLGQIEIAWTNEDGVYWEKWVPREEVLIKEFTIPL